MAGRTTRGLTVTHLSDGRQRLLVLASVGPNAADVERVLAERFCKVPGYPAALAVKNAPCKLARLPEPLALEIARDLEDVGAIARVL